MVKFINQIMVTILILTISFSLVNAERFGFNNPNLPNFVEDFFGGNPSSFYMPNNKSVFGNFSFNGGFLNGGCTIRDGAILCQEGFFVNISSLNITQQNLTILEDLIVNGNIFPDSNDTGSVGSFTKRWNQGFFSTLNVSNLGGLSPINVESNLIGSGFNFTADNFFGNINASLLENPPWVERAGDNMTGNLTIINANLTVDDYVGIGTRTPTSQLTIIGSLNQSQGNFTGNFIHGEMSNNTLIGITIILNVVNQFENITGLISNSLNGFSFANDSLIVQVPGRYSVQYSISATSAANSRYRVGVSINNVIQDETLSETTIGAGGNIVNLGNGGILDLIEGDFLNLQIADVDTPIKDITYTIADIDLIRISE